MFSKAPQYLLEAAGTFKIGYLEMVSLIIIHHIANYLEYKGVKK